MAEENLLGLATHPREPICVHSMPGQHQPMSACRICCDSKVLAGWMEYWNNCLCEHAEADHKDERQEWTACRSSGCGCLAFSRRRRES